MSEHPRKSWWDVAKPHIGTVEGADEVVHRHPIRPAELEDPGRCIGSVDSPRTASATSPM